MRLENGTVSLLLVTGFAGALGDDLDPNDDGTLDLPAGVTVVDSIAVNDGTTGDLTYGGVTLGVAYDGEPFAPGGASRIPDGTDTDSTADWVRNDFDLAGIPGNTGTLIDTEAAEHPGCGEHHRSPRGAARRGELRGADRDHRIRAGYGDLSPSVGDTVEIEGVVVGDFQSPGGYDGYYLQDTGDGNTATSDGIFVYAPGGLDVAVGDEVHVVGEVSEFFGMTEITADAAAVCATGLELPAATEFSHPGRPRGVRVARGHARDAAAVARDPRDLRVRALRHDRRRPRPADDAHGGRRARVRPSSLRSTAQNLAERITIDDGRFVQNPDPAIHPNGDEFTLENSFRGGDLVSNLTGVLDHRRDGTDNSSIRWRVQPTDGADFEAVNLRAENGVPEVGGTTKVASFNVLNYFTTLNSRGANDAEEFERQESKIVSAIAEIDADIVGLIEIENNGDVAVGALVEAINEEVGAGTYDFISTGPLGTDVITTALIYKPAEVAPAGAHAVLTEVEDPRFNTDHNRPALAQTFTDLQAGGEVTVVVNHLKSKGSACAGDPDLGDGAGNCNVTRTLAAEALADWLAGDPTGQGAGNEIIMGDLNSYDKEDPIDVFRSAGYTDLLFEHQGEQAYSYVFDGQLGYLDYALAGTGLDRAGDGRRRLAHQLRRAEHHRLRHGVQAAGSGRALRARRVAFERPRPGDRRARPRRHRARADGDGVTRRRSSRRTTSGARSDIDIEATDNVDADVTVELVSATAEGHKADIRVISDTEVEVLARNGAVYTLVYDGD